jgi:hypothetical protein
MLQECYSSAGYEASYVNFELRVMLNTEGHMMTVRWKIKIKVLFLKF